MRVVLYFAAVVPLAGAAGCLNCGGGGRPGFEFKVFRPAVSFAPVVVNERSSEATALPLGTTVPPSLQGLDLLARDGRCTLGVPFQRSEMSIAPGGAGFSVNGGEGAALNDIGRMLGLILQRLDRMSQERIPPPKGGGVCN